VLNPKVTICYLTLLSQFLVPERDTLFQFAILGLIAIIVALVWFLFIVTMLNYIRGWFEKTHIQKLFNQISGGLFIVLSLKLAFAEK